jgi:hypothetical protein
MSSLVSGERNDMDGNEFSTSDSRPAHQLMVAYGGMAFMRRGHRAEQAFEVLVQRLKKQREEMLGMVRLRLATLTALIGGKWERLESFLSPHDAQQLRELEADLRPQLQAPLEPATSDRPVRRVLEELKESVTRFNRRWAEALTQADCTEVNRRRDEYNRNYLIEKECAIGSALLAKREFRKLEPLSAKDLQSIVPLLNEFEFLGRS